MKDHTTKSQKADEAKQVAEATREVKAEAASEAKVQVGVPKAADGEHRKLGQVVEGPSFDAKVAARASKK